jgi:hypothetical protein
MSSKSGSLFCPRDKEMQQLMIMVAAHHQKIHGGMGLAYWESRFKFKGEINEHRRTH